MNTTHSICHLFSTVTVAVACSFPPDHPTISLNDLPAFSETEVYTLISVFTDPFSDCSGCVTEMSACYVVFLGQPTPLSVLIINEDSRITHVYNTVAYLTSSDNQDTNCTVIDQFFTLCCLRQILTPSEQFTVQSNHHFGVWSTEQVHAQQTTTPGYFTEGNISVGDTLTNFEGRETITKSYVYLNITPGTMYIVQRMTTHVHIEISNSNLSFQVCTCTRIQFTTQK